MVYRDKYRPEKIVFELTNRNIRAEHDYLQSEVLELTIKCAEVQRVNEYL